MIFNVDVEEFCSNAICIWENMKKGIERGFCVVKTRFESKFVVIEKEKKKNNSSSYQ